MKYFMVKCLLLAAICFSFTKESSAQRIYVSVQPRAVIVAHPAAPAPNYVWIEGEWTPKGRTYVYHPGYWIAPRRHYAWVPGHWEHFRRGWYWKRGYWERV